ncbi:MAG: hypothetical protein SO360_06880 [Bifidobacterium tsurumiense]|uniref:sensor histidine kinase n=1 Tax=Bifidobacterium tsurumiense TaxID=356829 RepID=UPI002A81891E|nr:hypothetical protein [Bifidobacterium tsurumiense]MDY4678564.1 hypothetical protein [Bifidobacterium tsurumiense]
MSIRPKPLSLAHAVSDMDKRRQFDLVFAVLCVAFFGLELSTIVVDPPFAWIMYAIYVVAVCCMPVVYAPSALALCALSLVMNLIPQDVSGPSIEWGVWYALIVLALRWHKWPAFCVAMTVIVGRYIGAALAWGWLEASTLGITWLCVLAYLIGVGLRVWKHQVQRRQRDLALTEQRERQIHMLRIMHDSVAGTLSVAVLRCRNARATVPERSSQANEWEQVEVLISKALLDIRSEIIEPAWKLLDGAEEAEEVEKVEVPRQVVDISHALPERLDYTDEFLAALGYEGRSLMGDMTRCDSVVAAMLPDIITELGTNIAKHGAPGEYALVVQPYQGEGVRVTSSNILATHGEQRGSSYGLRLMESRLQAINGQAHYGVDGDEWTIAIQIPSQQ